MENRVGITLRVIVFVGLPLQGLTSYADFVETIDGRQFTGHIHDVRTDTFVLERATWNNTNKQLLKEPPLTLPFEDVTRIIIDPWTNHALGDFRILGSRFPIPQEVPDSGVPLRQGLHRIAIVTQGIPPTILYEGPDLVRQAVPASAFSRPLNVDSSIERSAIDADGFREAEKLEKTEPGLHYRWYQSDQWSDMRTDDSAQVELKRQGGCASIEMFARANRNDLAKAFDPRPTRRETNNKPLDISAKKDPELRSENDHDLIIFEGFLKVERDGVYRFFADDDTILGFIGRVPTRFEQTSLLQTTRRNDSESATWIVRLVGGGELLGYIERWTEEGISLVTMIDKERRLEVPYAYISRLLHPENQNRLNKRSVTHLARGNDRVTVIMGEKRISSVLGKVTGTADDSLIFEFDGRPRKIKLDRVVAIDIGSLHATNQPTARTPQSWNTYLLASLLRGQRVPARLIGRNENQLSLAAVWGQEFEITDARMVVFNVRNGRLQHLSELEPVSIEQTPFFDRMLPWQRDQSLDGGPLQLGKGTYQRGISLHSRTRLTYPLDRNYESFRSLIGLDPVHGRLGDVAVTVRADGKTLFHVDHLTRDDSPIDVDLDVSGANQLTIEVDFGGGQDVQDRVHFANARLVKTKIMAGE